ncbi:phosphatidylserine decarboxylase proenzyme 2-like isoform X2 [Iris pallida]|uniref:Phosphatidylserine decarboxylase proenzyme 2-like isoform X2 n=1 Tax=Iris pallida TaxID=29817 RepID=A0AAX6HB45_IRIPA|nr:phosphatidylserine decarboxylase proenzyme 2-like isoform X2 [Iris pallida]
MKGDYCRFFWLGLLLFRGFLVRRRGGEEVEDPLLRGDRWEEVELRGGGRGGRRRRRTKEEEEEGRCRFLSQSRLDVDPHGSC